MKNKMVFVCRKCLKNKKEGFFFKKWPIECKKCITEQIKFHSKALDFYKNLTN